MDSIPIRHIHTVLKQQEASYRFSIRNVQDLLTGEDMQEPLHRHDFFYILILKTGTGQHHIDFQPYPITNHSAFLVRPGQVHELTLHTGSSGYLIQFSEGFYTAHDQQARRLLRKAGNINYYTFDARRFQKLAGILQYISDEYTHQEERYQEAIRSQLSVFFIELLRDQRHIAATQEPHYFQERLDTFTELVETHYAEYKQVSQYAAMMHLTTYQLNAITKQTLDKTCSEVINDISYSKPEDNSAPLRNRLTTSPSGWAMKTSPILSVSSKNIQVIPLTPSGRTADKSY
ncbi:AraC family transcriptional regulator [Chitinophaga pinensis]|uniref:AraC family transcriptional regulator n=1 Tax=Chitinophaga pinensis TaxID=79329 RepID=A0A5C6LRM4_9BACT|nr:AraC family ligand binding domain-containing protein [Chitinophaga pinensis]TWV99129.1 AraC family transcriptional regulator [Chitinophaga pinensis]